MKPTIAQQDTLDTITVIMRRVNNSNDLSSPTVLTDIKEELYARIEHGTDEMVEELTELVQDIICVIRRIK